jgi:hypothetical protein
MKFDPQTMEVIEDGRKHAIVRIKTDRKVFNALPGSSVKIGDPIYEYGVLVKKGNYIHRGQTYSCGPTDADHGSFVQDRFYKLEGIYDQKRFESFEKFMKGSL